VVIDLIAVRLNEESVVAPSASYLPSCQVIVHGLDFVAFGTGSSNTHGVAARRRGLGWRVQKMYLGYCTCLMSRIEPQRHRDTETQRVDKKTHAEGATRSVFLTKG